METALTTQGNGAMVHIDDATLAALVTEGDCSKLTEPQRLAYYKARCDAAGLDYRAQPFQFVKLNSKLVLYALKACSDQLAAKHGIKTQILSQETTSDGIRIVTVRAITRDGRETDDIGAVSIKSMAGESLANALMKATTKAKRRAVLSVCGLGMMDETEVESIPHVRAGQTLIDSGTGEIIKEGAARPPNESDRARLPDGGGAPEGRGVPGQAGSLPVAASSDPCAEFKAQIQAAQSIAALEAIRQAISAAHKAKALTDEIKKSLIEPWMARRNELSVADPKPEAVAEFVAEPATVAA